MLDLGLLRPLSAIRKRREREASMESCMREPEFDSSSIAVRESQISSDQRTLILDFFLVNQFALRAGLTLVQMWGKSATNLCLSDDPESFAEAATQAPRRKNDLMGAKTEEVAQVRSGPPFLDARQICLRRRACVNFHECRREIFVRRLVHTFF